MTRSFSPKLTLLLGPAGCGKTQTCIRAFESSLKSSRALLKDDFLFILPTAEHRARILDLALRRGLPGFFHRRITTFDRSLKELLKLGGLDYATDVTRRILLKELFLKLELDYFRNISETKGFLELISRTIVEFKEYLIGPRELESRLVALQKSFPEFESKYNDLIKIYSAYETELTKRELIDQRDALKLLEQGLGRGEYQDPELRRVWIDGFSDFSKLQLAFIDFLTRHADEVTVTLTLDRDPLRRPLFTVVSDTRTALEDLGFKAVWVEGPNHRAQNRTLKHLEQNLLRESDVTTVAPDSAIQVFEATGFQGEIEMIAREIKRIVLAHHYHFSDIAVLFRATNPYVSVIQSVFGKFKIPVELHERFRLRTSLVARTLISFFEIMLNDWNRKDIFNFLKATSRCRQPEEHLTNDEGSQTGGSFASLKMTSEGHYELICELELRALEKGVYRDRDYWLRSFPHVKEFEEIAQFEDQFLAVQSVGGFAAWVKSFLKHFRLLDFPDSGDDRTRMDREGARRIFVLLEELKRKKTNAQVVAKGLARDFLALIDVDLFSVHGRDKNKVQVYNVSLARQKEYKVVFVGGLLEKQFPIQVAEDPVLSDLERRVLNEKGEVLKERLPRQAFERYLFYLAVTRAREQLILTYPRFNLEGKEALPSFYVEEVQVLYQNPLSLKKQHVADVLPPLEDVSTYEEAEQRVIRDLWDAPAPEETHATFALYNHLTNRPHFATLVRRLLEPIEGVITDERIPRHFGPHEGTWSPTRLEEYAECSYRFFAHQMLKLEPQAEGVDIRRRGIILHDVLEAFFTWWRDEKKSHVTFDEAKEFCLKTFQKFWDEEPLKGDRFYKIELERKRMQEMILQILRTEFIDGKPPISGLVPTHFEYAFKNLVLQGKRQTLTFRGKIDRIDVDPGGRFGLVIDYKSGKPFHLGALEKGTSLQLPLYLIAIREQLGLEPLGGHLYQLSDATSKGFHHAPHLNEAKLRTKKRNRYSGVAFETLLRRSVLFSEKYASGIEHAKIPVRPRDCVSYCPYSSLCRIDKWRLEHIYRELAEEDRDVTRETVVER